MNDIGVTISIPAGSVPEGTQLKINIHPVVCGDIEMPDNCIPHSPLYIMSPIQMQKEIDITIEHDCNIESEEDRDNMVFLGLESLPQSGSTCRLREINDAVSNFKIGDQKGKIFLKDLQSLRIGRRVSPDLPNKGTSTLMYRHYTPYFATPY